uniref:Uncharacterized protein n=1 Tax=Rhizochromulina marina TaxID=1034831 RepID=A0A7S2WQZ3_9STRA|mmetsp:Transcript_3142/g.9093  ORF Transcript_3142/g.9093 Transcript_3142/m.9093 type:complete len:161 (+) Transcript_3142:1-483(+)
MKAALGCRALLLVLLPALETLRGASAWGLVLRRDTHGRRGDFWPRRLPCAQVGEGGESQLELPEGNTSEAISSVPEPGSGMRTMVVNGNAVTLDELGPVVVSQDGQLRRIDNWQTMSPEEQELTLRMVGRRNQKRLARLRQNGNWTEGGELKDSNIRRAS